jgi:hypothetical protein
MPHGILAFSASYFKRRKNLAYLTDEPAAVPETSPRPVETGNAPPSATAEAPPQHKHRGGRSQPHTINLDQADLKEQESWQEPSGDSGG